MSDDRPFPQLQKLRWFDWLLWTLTLVAVLSAWAYYKTHKPLRLERATPTDTVIRRP